jgi:putative N-acetyltransferase (TIGR04045 family)
MLEKLNNNASAAVESPGPDPKIDLRVASGAAEIEAHFKIRRQVFVEEHGLFEGTDRDTHDDEGIHIVACLSGKIVGAVRCYPEGEGVWYGGRLAVHPDFRKYDLGARLVRKAVETMECTAGVTRFLANIQIQNVRFFKRLGWIRIGEPFLYRGVRHQVMEKVLCRCAE